MNDITHLEMHNKKHQELIHTAEKRHLANTIRKPKPSAMKALFMQVLTLATRS